MADIELFACRHQTSTVPKNLRLVPIQVGGRWLTAFFNFLRAAALREVSLRHGEDLGLAEQVVRERHPKMAEAMEKYLSRTVCCFGNICIVKRPMFRG